MLSFFIHGDESQPFTDIDTPIQPGGSKGSEPSADQIGMLADMGFTAAQAKKALRETVSQSLFVRERGTDMWQ